MNHTKVCLLRAFNTIIADIAVFWPLASDVVTNIFLNLLTWEFIWTVFERVYSSCPVKSVSLSVEYLYFHMCSFMFKFQVHCINYSRNLPLTASA